MLELSIHNKQFIVTANKSGLSNEETIFHYYEQDGIIIGTYCGGEIVKGQIIGKRLLNNCLELVFQCVTKEGELKSGQSKGVISKNSIGKIALSFDWKWLNGDLSGGKSFYQETDEE